MAKNASYQINLSDAESIKTIWGILALDKSLCIEFYYPHDSCHLELLLLRNLFSPRMPIFYKGEIEIKFIGYPTEKEFSNITKELEPSLSCSLGEGRLYSDNSQIIFYLVKDHISSELIKLAEDYGCKVIILNEDQMTEKFLAIEERKLVASLSDVSEETIEDEGAGPMTGDDDGDGVVFEILGKIPKTLV